MTSIEESRLQELILQTLYQNAEGMAVTSLADTLGYEQTQLFEACKHLSDTDYIEAKNDHGVVIFIARDPNDVEKFQQLKKSEEKIVYQFIKSYGNRGTWTKYIKEKTGLHQKLVNDALKNLETRKFIKLIKSVKQPTRKVYMLYELNPSEDLTGGSWYTDQAMDVEFIDQMATQILKYIHAKSFPPKGIGIFNANYSKYPTTRDVHDWVQRSRITTQELSMGDIQQLIDRLGYDGSLRQYHCSSEDELDIYMYQSRMPTNGGMIVEAGVATALTDAPCGKCQAFDFCCIDGPVNPCSCPYLKEWLAF